MKTLRYALIGLILGSLSLMGGVASTNLSVPASALNLTPFASQGHVLGFQRDGFLLSNASYALRVEFVGANPVAPISSSPTQLNQSEPVPLTQVTYPELWEGITLAYDAPPGSILRSTYTLAPRSSVEQIRLRYNAPVTMNADGTLGVTFAGGQVSETAPVAWQEIEGRRKAVAVAFVKRGEREVGFALEEYDPERELVIDPLLTWNTFLGGESHDSATGIAVDGGGNVYVVGNSGATWGDGECTGCPIRPFTPGSESGMRDAFAAKLDANGVLIWNTFLGGHRDDWAAGIGMDANGNVYATGGSDGTWGEGECSDCPIRPFTPGSGGWVGDAFAAKLNPNGELRWNTFLGGSDFDGGRGIAADMHGNVYAAGYSFGTWGEGECSGCPIRPWHGQVDAFTAKLDSNGALLWHTFLGGSMGDFAEGIALDKGGNVYVAGDSHGTWGEGECTGCPIRPYIGGPDWMGDAFAAKLESNGTLTWNTFLGGSMFDIASGITVDEDGCVFLAGTSMSTWGAGECPGCLIPPYKGRSDAFATKLDANGTVTWNTFLGGSGNDGASEIAVDANGNVYVSGLSYRTWGAGECPGCPIRPYIRRSDAFATKLDANGVLAWNTFLGGIGADSDSGITVDGSGNMYLAGTSEAAWGFPNRPFTGNPADAFVVKIPAVPACTEKPESPFPFRPRNGSHPKGRRVKLDWSDTACADRYQVIVREGSRKGKRVFNEDGLTKSSVRTEPLTSGMTYFWRVVAKNGFGKTKSVWYKFTLK